MVKSLIPALSKTMPEILSIDVLVTVPDASVEMVIVGDSVSLKDTTTEQLLEIALVIKV